jgi:hypothetical protein
MPGCSVTFDPALQDVPEDRSPLKSFLPKGPGSHPPQPASSAKGAYSSAALSRLDGSNPESVSKRADTAQQVADGDRKLQDIGGGGASWLSPRLRWPVVPMYSNVGTSEVPGLQDIYLLSMRDEFQTTSLLAAPAAVCQCAESLLRA